MGLSRGRSPISPCWEDGSDLFSQNHLISGPWTNCRSATRMSRCPSTRLSSPPVASSPPLRVAVFASLGVFSSLQVENPRKDIPRPKGVAKRAQCGVRLRKSSRLHKSHNALLTHTASQGPLAAPQTGNAPGSLLADETTPSINVRSKRNGITPM